MAESSDSEGAEQRYPVALHHYDESSDYEITEPDEDAAADMNTEEPTFDPELTTQHAVSLHDACKSVFSVCHMLLICRVLLFVCSYCVMFPWHCTRGDRLDTFSETTVAAKPLETLIFRDIF